MSSMYIDLEDLLQPRHFMQVPTGGPSMKLSAAQMAALQEVYRCKISSLQSFLKSFLLP